MKTRLNEAKATKLMPKKASYEVRDEVVRGLILRVGKKGVKVWEVVVSVGGRRRRERLGVFPALSVKEARMKAEEAKATALNPVAAMAARTVADVFEAYKAQRQNRMRTWNDVQSVWDCWARDRIGHIRTTDLTLHHGLDLRNHVSEESSPLRAGAVIRYLRPMMAWAEEERLVAENPWLRLKVGVTATSRDRVLSSSEWQRLWNAGGAMPYPFGPFTRALMLSAQRSSNVAAIRWDEIHGDVWTIPREKVKATRPDKAAAHEVPLSGAFAGLIAEQPRFGEYVFTTRGDVPIYPGSKLKAQLSEAAELSDWRFHDVRRTGATLMTTGKVTRFIVERVLGHSDNTVTATYDRSTYRDEKRDALEVLAATVGVGAMAQVYGLRASKLEASRK
ncbi:MAG: tyrosine-type recombinase/integrase [Rhodobacteraceae bacterium]|nr:tyrosine-type recombinase/integrase [Paracoccaceae bacterium]